MQISVCVFIVRRERVRHTEMNGVEMGREWEKWRTRWYFWMWAACDLAFSIRIKYIFWTTWNILAPCLELSLFIVCFVVVQYILAAVRSLIKPVANASACPCQYQIQSAYTCVCCWFCKPYICCIVQMCLCVCVSQHTHTHFTALRMVSPFFPSFFLFISIRDSLFTCVDFPFHFIICLLLHSTVRQKTMWTEPDGTISVANLPISNEVKCRLYD